MKTVFGSGGVGGGTTPVSALPPGFHMPSPNLSKYNIHFSTHSYVEGYSFSEKDRELLMRLEGVSVGPELVHLKRWMGHIRALVEMGEEPVSVPMEEETEEMLDGSDSGCEDEDEDESDEDSGWITPSNYKPRPETLSTSPVALLSTDFAIQVS